jgi:hypothetical protein
MIGARLAGWDTIDGIEMTDDYIPIAEARIKWWSQFKSYAQAEESYQSAHRGEQEDAKLEARGQLRLFD